ncbi:MAG: YdeI/OmpD-associated family protein [Pyrinomonadaceae bacterium]
MQITDPLYLTSRREWRKWLRQNHARRAEVWLLSYRQDSGKSRIAYNDAVEEALCFGWIDGIAKKLDAESSAQRFTPRRSKSNWSELNKERARRLIASGQMTAAGLAALGDALETGFEVPADIIAALKADRQTWRNFQTFPDNYQRIRIGYIEEVGNVPPTLTSGSRTF